MKTAILSWLFLPLEKQVGCSMGAWTMDSPDSILARNHYSGVKVKLEKNPGCLPEGHLKSFHSQGAVTGVTDVELDLLYRSAT